ncbi:hypothetical protein [Micromonospora sp. DT48]|uniref:hypothetical protein n=1 Tax=Micromonospora sp. DT48 TaxID=3393429 RepID=UPI003CF8927A
MKWVSRLLILVVGGGIAAGGAPAQAAESVGADQSPRADSRHQAIATITPADLPRTEVGRGQQEVRTGQSCTAIAPAARAAVGGAVKSCVDTTPQAVSRTGSAGTAAANEACDITLPGYWTWTRTSGLCLNGMTVTYTLYSDRGAVLGTGVMNVATSMTLSQSSAAWNESVTVKVTGVSGEVKSLDIAFDVACTSTCSATTNRPWPGSRNVGPGASASGTVTYRSAVASGARDTNIQTKYHMYVTTAGSIPTTPNVYWDSPVQAPIRCDAELSTPGCVIPERRAILEYSVSDPNHGEAAALYQFAQAYLRGWAPLSRTDSEAIRDANRERTCGAGSSDPFVFMPEYVPNDSCDEFPFAGTYEGGTDGRLCADILPLYEDGQWVLYEARADKPVTFNEPCVRGHVDVDANSSAGGKYGAFVRNQRVLDTEKFDVHAVS